MAVSSCKTDTLILPINASSRLTTISQLPADRKIRPQEMFKWYSANLESSEIQPKWNLSMETVHNGNHVIEVLTSKDAALFFTKVNGNLDVYAYKWLNKASGGKAFTGDVIYYFFKSGKITASVYNKGKLVKTDFMSIPAEHTMALMNNLMTRDDWISPNTILN